MSTPRFLGQLRERGIELRAEGEKLVVNAPKGAVTEEVADEIRRRRGEILAFLRMGADARGPAAASGPGGAASGETGILPRAALPAGPDGALEAPLSFGQRRLFYLDQLEPGLAVYNVPVAFRLAGPLDPEALRGALGDLLARHSILRTTLVLGRDGPVQRIAKVPTLDLQTADLTGEADPTKREALCETLLREHACRPFDLARGPLMRFLLVRLGPEENVLLSTAHHVVTDGWSQEVLEREICALHDARRRGAQAGLAPLPHEYADYAVWQASTAKDPERLKRLERWKEALKGPLAVLDLPVIGARPEMAPTEGDIVSAALPKGLVEPLAALARREQATLFMVLLAAYATLLHRVTGQDEVVVGTPIANRAHAETLGMIGYFANTLALRIDLSGSPTFVELLGRVRRTCLAAYEGQDIPFEELVEALNVERDLGRSPIFQTIFGFEDAMPVAGRRQEGAEDGLRVTKRDTIHARVARTDLSAWVSAGEEGLVVTLEYPTALFDAAGTRRTLDGYRVLLEGVASDAAASIDRLPILSAAERRQLLLDWNDTARPLPDVLGVQEMFALQAARTPERVAVEVDGEALSYGALLGRVNRLANHLAAQGVQPGALVGVFLERSIGMVVALLAVLEAGAAYVPIDPEYPADRIAWMIEDSKLGVVVTSESVADRLPAGVRAVLLDAEAAEIAEASAERPARGAESAARGEGLSPRGESACYVIYTSGSTGRPKGVVVPHRALVNFLSSMAVRPGLSADDTLVAVTTLSFDIAGLELFLPLTVGARLVVATGDQASDGPELRALLESSGATAMQATPATWRLLVGAGFQGGAGFKVLCGGEALPPDLVGTLLRTGGQLWNMYGPTETTIWSTCAQITAEDPRVTIGRPIDNTTVHILDARGEPVPVGVRGELHIGGLGVSLGYLGRPELTAERFVPDPFGGRGALLYRTGDLASRREDGALVYHRRLDHQVKLRGHRIEPGEIEAVLAEHDAIAQAVVLVREDRPGDARLVAYIVPKVGRTITASDVRKHLRRRLPEYMIPQHVVELPRMPLTPAGKVARRELAAPAGAAQASRSRAPETASERSLARIWAEVLGTDRIAATDNFFDLGGHSLLSMTVIARVAAETGVRVGPRDLLLQTLEQIAARLAGGAGASSGVAAKLG